MKKIRVVELFAGVGGFRIGFDRANKSTKTQKFEVVWSSQWEPGVKAQHASDIYVARFGDKGHSNEDIEAVIEHNFSQIPTHDLLVGGFPCQDYSVARTLSQAKGLAGQKGVLWWSIYNILNKMGDKAPEYLMLENVDRLLKSPASQRGRDFAVMLASLSDQGYAVEWRVINAADYGMPQRRRRVFILGYKKGSAMYDKILNCSNDSEFIINGGVTSAAFPVEKQASHFYQFEIHGNLSEVSNNFANDKPKLSKFQNSGLMVNRLVTTQKVVPDYSGKQTVLGSLLQDEDTVPAEYYVDKKSLDKWKHMKGGKKEERKTKAGFTYHYSEGAMAFPDALDRPSRTIVTGEGGSTPSRFKHVIKTESGKLRRLTPLELEMLNMFPKNHTKLAGVSDTKRAFIMGNALVVGVIERLGIALAEIIKK